MFKLVLKSLIIILIFLSLFDFVHSQNYNEYDDVGEERLHHKKKKKNRYRPCRRSDDNSDGKTLAVNLFVNNYPHNGGGSYDPCSSGYPSSGGQGGGGGSHLGGLLGGNILSSHPILSGLLGGLGGSGGGYPSGGNRPSTAIATAIAGAGSPSTQPESLGGGQGGNLGTILGAVSGAATGSNSRPIADNVHEDQEDIRDPLFPRESSIVGAYLDLFGFGGGYNRPHVSHRPNYNQYNNQIYANPYHGYNNYDNYQNNYYRDPAYESNSKFLGYSNNNLNGNRHVDRNVRPNYRLFK